MRLFNLRSSMTLWLFTIGFLALLMTGCKSSHDKLAGTWKGAIKGKQTTITFSGEDGYTIKVDKKKEFKGTYEITTDDGDWVIVKTTTDGKTNEFVIEFVDETEIRLKAPGSGIDEQFLKE